MKKLKKNKISNILFYVCIIVAVGIIGVYISLRNNKLKFNEEEWQYMYSYIENEFGNGEEFHVISTKTDLIKEFERQKVYDDGSVVDYYKTLGIRASIVGYFDSQENMYSVSFSKFLEDSKIYKNGKAGTIIFTAVVNNYSKDEYLKGGEK